MLELLNNPLSRQFNPCRYCDLWQSKSPWLSIALDAPITLVYYSILVMLVYLVGSSDLPFRVVFLMGLLIIACNTTYFLQIWTLWYRRYWPLLLVAITSMCTATKLILLASQVFILPSSTQIRSINLALENKIAERQRVFALNAEPKKGFCNT